MLKNLNLKADAAGWMTQPGVVTTSWLGALDGYLLPP